MSTEAITDVLAHTRVEPPARLLLLVIAHHINHKTGYTYLGRERLAQETGFTERHVKRLLAELERQDELIIERGTGRGHANVYRLPERGTSVSPFPERGTSVSPFTGRKGDIEVQKGGQVEPERGTPESPLHLVPQRTLPLEVASAANNGASRQDGSEADPKRIWNHPDDWAEVKQNNARFYGRR